MTNGKTSSPLSVYFQRLELFYFFYETMRHLDLFSGIGGFALAVEAVWPEAEHIFCDNDPFCQAILKKHWPQSKLYSDIRELTMQKYIDDCNNYRYDEGVCNTNARSVERKKLSTVDNFGAPSVSKNGAGITIGRTQKSPEAILINIGKQICNDIENSLKRGETDCAKKSLIDMGASVSVAEKIIGLFFRLTTKTMTDSKIENSMDSDICTSLLNDADFQALIKSFATTVITPKQYIKYALTKNDIRALTNTADTRSEEMRQGRENEIFLLTGGFPCQPFSHAGKRKGTNDDRHLWPEMRRVIQEFSPRFVVAENVRGLLSIDGGMVFEQVCLDLEALGYEVQAFVIPACAVNAPHRRDRVWFVARNTKHDGRDGTEDGESSGTGSNSNTSRAEEDGESQRPALPRNDTTDGSRGWQRSSEQKGDGAGESEVSPGDLGWNQDWPTVATRLCSLDDGLPNGLARPRGWRNAALKGAGNAIVPQVAIEILQAIKLCPSQSKT